MNIVLRKSTQEDWSIIQKLNLEVYLNSNQFDQYMNPDDPDSEESTKGFQDDVINPDKFCMIAEIDGNPIGYLVGFESNLSWRTNRRGEINHMGVSPKYRSHGIGSMLVAEFKKWCLNRGLTHVATTTYYDDAKARHFYEKQGMKPIDVTLEGSIENL